jgi:predicted PurR-regulated permease PerM
LHCLATGLFLIAGLYCGRQVFIPLTLAVVLAFLLTPIVGLLEKGHLGRTPSVLAVLMLSFALMAAVGWGVTIQWRVILDHLADYKANIDNKSQPCGRRAEAAWGRRQLRFTLSAGSCRRLRKSRKTIKSAGMRPVRNLLDGRKIVESIGNCGLRICT